MKVNVYLGKKIQVNQFEIIFVFKTSSKEALQCGLGASFQLIQTWVWSPS